MLLYRNILYWNIYWKHIICHTTETQSVEQHKCHSWTWRFFRSKLKLISPKNDLSDPLALHSSYFCNFLWNFTLLTLLCLLKLLRNSETISRNFKMILKWFWINIKLSLKMIGCRLSNMDASTSNIINILYNNCTNYKYSIISQSWA